MLEPNSPLFNTVVLYIIFVIILLVTKPSIMYDRNLNKFKRFGYEENETLVPFSLCVVSSGIVFYLLFSTLDNLCSK